MSPTAARRPAAPGPALTANMAGAVDLAAVKARADAAARAAESPPPAPGGYLVDVTEASFQVEVIDRSFQVPVLIDLWAEWCEPCKQLSPTLEKLVAEGNGSWVLAKIDVDANQRIAQALQVQSIPTVFAVIGGQLAPGFQGALPEPQVREFVRAVLQAGAQGGLTGAQAPPADGESADGPGVAGEPEQELPGDPRFTAAEQALEDGDYSLAVQRYQAILDAEPTNPDAAAALRQVRLLQRVEKLDSSVLARADATPDDIDAQLAAADFALSDNDIDAALTRLLGLVKRLSGDDRDAVRQRLIEYFDVLGPDDPHVAPARRELAAALF